MPASSLLNLSPTPSPLGEQWCPKGLMRDPFLLYHPPSDRFVLLWTTGWAATTIGFATSDDLVHWSAQRAIEVTRGLADPIVTWAPEAVFDPDSGETPSPAS